jgi:uncharacterized protein YhbP (UPF0306 family)
MAKSNEELKETVLDYLKTHNTMTLATTRDNRPWAASVFYASDGFTLYFISDPEVCWHSQNIAENPHVSATVDEDYRLENPDDWRKVKGIQLEGIAEMLTSEEEVARAVAAYVKKYPFVSIYLKSIIHFPRVISFLEKFAQKLPFVPDFKAVSENKFYKVVPTRVWFVDNETSFERRQEVFL